MNYGRFLNATSLARRPSPIRLITALLAKSPPSMISLATGMPNPTMFPFQSAQFKLKDGQTIEFDEEKMKMALQYCPTPGHGNLVSWMLKLQKHYHNPPTMSTPADQGGMDVCVTPGCQDAICKSFEMLTNRGDHVIVDSPTYPGTLAVLRPLGVNMIPVATDHQGMQPDDLLRALSRWTPAEAQNESCTSPRLLYTIPNGVNPTGSTLSVERKHQIYQIARDYNMLILEDDPYFFLQFRKDPLDSFLSMDVDGRVLRFDSFSKVLSSGLRLGVASGPQPLIYRLVLHQMVSSMHTSTLSQLMASELLDKWGLEGFQNHVQRVVQFYSSQRDAMLQAADKWLTGLAEWEVPSAGMFLWIKFKEISDSRELIEKKAVNKQVMLVPGYAFMPDDTKPCPYVRAAYSLATPQQMDTAMQRLAELIKEEISLQKKS